MRNILSLSAIVLLGSASVAGAQESPNSQTLDGQMQRVQSGQDAVPGAWDGSSSSMSKAPEQKPLVRRSQDWPASAAAQTAPRRPHYPQSPSAGYIDSVGGNAIPAMPLEIRTAGDVRYITGGVGDEEEAQLKMVEKDYNLRLLTTGTGGAYVSGAMARITDANGTVVLSSDGVGPYLYADLKPGVYNVEVTAPEGGIKSTRVNVPASGFIKPELRFTE